MTIADQFDNLQSIRSQSGMTNEAGIGNVEPLTGLTSVSKQVVTSCGSAEPEAESGCAVLLAARPQRSTAADRCDRTRCPHRVWRVSHKAVRCPIGGRRNARVRADACTEAL